MGYIQSFLTLGVFLLAGGHKVLAAPLPQPPTDTRMAPSETSHAAHQDVSPVMIPDTSAMTPSTSTSSSTTATSFENQETNILSGNTIDRIGNVVGNNVASNDLNDNVVPVLSGNTLTLGDVNLDVIKRRTDASLLGSARRQAMRARHFARRWEA